MKKISAILILFLLIVLTEYTFAFQKNGTYECTYKIGEYGKGTCAFDTNENGDITSKFCSSDRTLDSMITEEKCTFTPDKNYLCEYPKGNCKVTLSKTGYFVVCSGNTPNASTAKEDAESGKCKNL